MGPIEMVRCSADDLLRISQEMKRVGVDVQAIYFLKVTSNEDSVFWNIRAVTTHDPYDFVYKFSELQSAKKIPPMDSDIRIKAIRPDDPEAERVLEYARQFREAPVVISNVAWKGLYIEYALVAEAPGLEKAAA
jgi:hypothetical protein